MEKSYLSSSTSFRLPTSSQEDFMKLQQSIFTVAVMLVFVVFVIPACKEGPAGPPGSTNLLDPSIQPAVISTYPASGTIGPFNLCAPGNASLPGMVVQFNKLIDVNRLMSAHPVPVTISGFDVPAGVRVHYYPIYILNSRKIADGMDFDDVVEFDVYDSNSSARKFYRMGDTYTVTIGAGVFDINGNQFHPPYQFSYLPEPYFRVSGVYPADGATGVYLNPTISLSFNSPVDTPILSTLSISPAVTGSWYLQDSMTAYYLMSNPLSFDTRYTVSVNSSAHDKAGHPIHAPFSSQFTAQSFGISYYSPYPNSVVNSSQELYFSFTSTVDTASLRSAFSIQPSVGVVLTISNYSLQIDPRTSWTSGTTYTIGISTDLHTPDGYHLQSPVTYRFTVR
jgi:hypothetical protein